MMLSLAKHMHFKGEVQNRDDGERLLSLPGDAVLVNRGIPRALLMKCPDGCGDNLAINLDNRTAKAWRLYDRGNRLTLYPSVWRDGGCGAHFIIWRDRIVWCGYKGVTDNSPEYDAELEAKVISALSATPKSDEEIAAKIEEIPWEVDRVLRKLAKVGRAKPVGMRPVRYMIADAVLNQTDSSAGRRRKRRWWRRFLGN